MALSWLTTTVIVSTVIHWTTTANAMKTHWRERSEYPKTYDIELYVTNPGAPLTGTRALEAGCDAFSRPYKYRGKRHVTELRNTMRQAKADRVWVGAVDTTTPWVWFNGHYLHQLLGVTSPDVVAGNVVRLPGNNAFLCSLHCGQGQYIALQGDTCACLTNRPTLFPISGELLRCPGTYEEYCGTPASFTVYQNMLAQTVKWAGMVSRAQYHGNRAYLYRPPMKIHPLVNLRAEDNDADTKGYICNGSVFTLGDSHMAHLTVTHTQSSTWRAALEACMNQGKQLMMLSRDTHQRCLQEIESDLKQGHSYWVGLSRRNAALWLDGSAVKTSVKYYQKGQAACLTLTLTSKSPTFTFESCSGLSLPVLCERDPNSQLQTFTHDAQGNHVITRTSGNVFTNWVVATLVAVLLFLSLLTIVLLMLLYHRDKWMPKKTQPSRKPPSQEGNICVVSPTGSSAHLRNSGHSGNLASRKSDSNLHVLQRKSDSDQLHVLRRKSDELHRCHSYAVVNKGKPLPPSGRDNSRPHFRFL